MAAAAAGEEEEEEEEEGEVAKGAAQAAAAEGADVPPPLPPRIDPETLDKKYQRWDKFGTKVGEEEEAVSAGGSLLGASALDRVRCTIHNEEHDLAEACPKCAAGAPAKKYPGSAAAAAVAAAAAAPSPPPRKAAAATAAGCTATCPGHHAAAAALKAEGNALLAAMSAGAAEAKYCAALAQLQEQSVAPCSRALLLALRLNLALAQLKQGKWADAAGGASAALALEPAHPKALYRRGIARAQLGEAGGARRDLRQALALSVGAFKGGRADARRELDALEAAVAEEEAAERERAGLAHLARGIEDMPDDEVTMEGCVTAMSRLARHMPDSQLAQVLGGKLDDVTEGRGGRS